MPFMSYTSFVYSHFNSVYSLPQAKCDLPTKIRRCLSILEHTTLICLLTRIVCLSPSSCAAVMSFSEINFRLSDSSWSLCRVSCFSRPIIFKSLSLNCCSKDSISRLNTFCSSASNSACLFSFCCRAEMFVKCSMHKMHHTEAVTIINLSVVCKSYDGMVSWTRLSERFIVIGFDTSQWFLLGSS